ncbi:MAG: hypothetical protein OCC46_12685 [Pseudodesulfovibrio sp.]
MVLIMTALNNRKKTLQIFLFCQLLSVLTVMAFVSPSAAEGGRVVVWSYYVYPPFVVEGNQGLLHDLIGQLNKDAHGKYEFHLHVMPRKRIDMHLAANDPGIVLLVSPIWMHAQGKSEYQWTPGLFADKNGLLFNRQTKVDYAGPRSVHGLKMGGVFGRKYKGLEESVADGDIIREDTQDEELNVLKLSERRIDFMTAPESVLRYLVNRLGVEDLVYFSPTPLNEYTRHILINNVPPAVEAFLMQWVTDLPSNPGWLAIKEKYQLQ